MANVTEFLLTYGRTITVIIILLVALSVSGILTTKTNTVSTIVPPPTSESSNSSTSVATSLTTAVSMTTTLSGHTTSTTSSTTLTIYLCKDLPGTMGCTISSPVCMSDGGQCTKLHTDCASSQSCCCTSSTSTSSTSTSSTSTSSSSTSSTSSTTTSIPSASFPTLSTSGYDSPAYNLAYNGSQTRVLDGVYGDLRTEDGWYMQYENATWAWDFDMFYYGKFTAVWYAIDSPGQCITDYGTDVTIKWQASADDETWTTFDQYAIKKSMGCSGSCLSTGLNVGSIDNPITSYIIGQYRYIRLIQYSSTSNMACPMDTYVDAVYTK